MCEAPNSMNSVEDSPEFCEHGILEEKLCSQCMEDAEIADIEDGEKFASSATLSDADIALVVFNQWEAGLSIQCICDDVHMTELELRSIPEIDELFNK